MKKEAFINVYSNGITTIKQKYDVTPEGCQVEIPIEQYNIEYILSTLNITGDVTFVNYPNYTLKYKNVDISKDKFLIGILSNLIGSEIEFYDISNDIAKVEGNLIGLQISESDCYLESSIIVAKKVNTDLVIGYHKLKNINKNIIVKDEKYINSISNIKDVIKFNLKSNNENTSSCYVSYTIPSSAWEMTYRIEDNKLIGLVKIDNPTEEDWIDCSFSVISGYPNTITDLPINNSPVFSLEENCNKAMRLCSTSFKPEVKVSNIDDYAVFTTKPTTIFSKSSILVPVLELDLVDLEYCCWFINNMVMKSIQFQNNYIYPLPSGVISLYEDGNYIGQSKFESLQKSQSCILPYAIENEINVTKVLKNKSSVNKKVSISDGSFEITKNTLYEYEYNIENKSDKENTLYIDYTKSPSNIIKIDGATSNKDIDSSLVRIQVKTNPGGNSILSVTESQQSNSDFVIQDENSILNFKNYPPEMESNPQFTQVISLAKKLSTLKQEVKDFLLEEEGITKTNIRLNQSPLISDFKEQIITNENRIKALQQLISDKKKEIALLTSEFKQLIKILNV